MKKTIKKYVGFLSLVFLFAMWATAVHAQKTFDFTERTWTNPFEESPYTISGDRAGGGNDPYYSTGKDVRFYGMNTMTVKDSSGKMCKIVFHISENGLKRWAALDATVGKVTADVKNKTATWESPNGEGVSELTLTVARLGEYGTEKNMPGQFCFSKIEIYEASGASSNAPSVSFGDNEGKTFTFLAGKNEQFVTPKATVTPSDATGSMSYASSDEETVTVDSEGQLAFTNTKFDAEATITAKWIGSGDSPNSNNSASYKVVNKKIPTTIAFEDGVEDATYTVKNGESFTGHLASLATKNAEGEMEYSSSNTSVASVDNATGDIEIKGVGTAIITAQFKGSGVYANSNTVSYIIVCKGDYIFYESFDKNVGIGGNDGVWNGINSASSAIYDNDGWSAKVAAGANGCVRAGTSSMVGSFTTPDIALSADGVLTFKAGGWLNDANSLIVTISNGQLTYNGNTSKKQTLKLVEGKWTEYTMKISGTQKFNITFTADKKRFFLDEVMVTDGVNLSEATDNSIPDISDVKVVLKRTMVQNEWNTLCLPFAVSHEQVVEAFGKDVVIAELDDAASVEANVLSFKKATEIEAAKPYLVKPSKESPADGYVFEGVSVNSSWPGVAITTGGVGFVGIYNPTDICKNVQMGEDIPEGSFAAFLGDGNKLYRANDNGSKMKGFRAYFAVPESSDAALLRISVDGTATSVIGIKAGKRDADTVIYNIQGQRINGKASGVYIKNGRKYVAK